MGRLVNSKELLNRALEGNYAVGAFNISNMEVIQGISAACAKFNSPVIFQVSESTRKYAGISFLVTLVETAIEEYNLEAALHLDHSSSFELCKECIDNGFTSVMMDASACSFDENIELTKKVVDYARNFDVSVEAELGMLSGIEEHKIPSKKIIYTDPEEAYEFVKKTDVDSLAIAVGTSHGAYKFKNKDNIELRFDIIEEISKLLPNIPLVLHGASSVDENVILELKKYNIDLNEAVGIPIKILKKVAQNTNICKINIDTDIRISSLLAVKKSLDNTEVLDPRNFMKNMRDSVEKVVSDKIINVLKSENMANI